jgi:hypothetical protein
MADLSLMAGDSAPGAAVGGWRWDVALSFAGAQRPYVERVATVLKARGVRVFYDADEQIHLWGRHLPEELGAVYAGQAAAVVVFVSADYAARDWTRWERRAALDRAVAERREYVLPARFDDTPLPGLSASLGTVDLRGLGAEAFAGMVVAKLGALGIIPRDETAAMSHLPEAWNAVGPGLPVEELDDPFALEVHPAIDAGARAAGLPTLPTYVPRDHDERLRDVVRRAVNGSSAVAVLVGGSSTGKTRACWEAVKTLPAGWRLWHPINPGWPEAALAELPRIRPRTVVWLNDAQHYLLTPTVEVGERVAAGMRDLLRDPGRRPVLVLATVWREYWAGMTTTPAPGQPDPHAQARALLVGADISVPDTFTDPAVTALRNAAAGDPRLAEAQKHADQRQITQYLAAAPALLERYRNAPPAAKALIEAAMDARRLGHGFALPHALLEAAAPGYLTDQQWDALGDNWLDQALAYTAILCRGVCAQLTRIRPRPGQTGYDQPHYRLADYLEQHARATRRTHRTPAAFWDAVLGHGAEADASRLADSAYDRLLHHYAIPLYRRAAEAGNGPAAYRLAGLLAERGDIAELRARADVGDGHATEMLASLADMLAGRGDRDGAAEALRALADAGDEHASRRLADMLAKGGDLDGLRARADAGDGHAAALLAGMLAKHGDLNGLRARAEAGDWHASRRLTDMLVESGDLDGAAEALRARAEAGNSYAARRLADILVESGDLDGLRARAEAGDSYAARRLADMLVGRRDLDGLRARAEAGDEHASRRLADMLVESGDLDGAAKVLRARAEAGDSYAARRLADIANMLVESGDLDGAAEQVHVVRGNHAGREFDDRIALCEEAVGGPEGVHHLAHFKFGVLDFSVYVLDQLDQESLPGETDMPHRISDIGDLGRRLHYMTRGVSAALQECGSGQLIRAVFDVGAGALLYHEIRWGEYLVGLVYGANRVPAAEKAVASSARKIRWRLGLPAVNPYGLTDEETRPYLFELVKAAILVPVGVASLKVWRRGDADDVNDAFLDLSSAKLRYGLLQFAARFEKSACTSFADTLDDARLDDLFKTSSPQRRREAYKEIGLQAHTLSGSVDRDLYGIMGRHIQRTVLGAERGALYVQHLDHDEYLLGVTLVQKWERAALGHFDELVYRFSEARRK